MPLRTRLASAGLFHYENNQLSLIMSSSGGAWVGWYKTARWRELKKACHIRDNFICQRTGRVCVGEYPDPDSPVANHKVPHRGDPALFWDLDNLETVTKRVHDSVIQREEQSSLHNRGRWG
jgi:5-methylcytosine-specific restriction endonuclease McrA